MSELSNLNVTMSNALTRAAHGLALGEKRVLAACIAQLDSVSASGLMREKTWLVKLSARDYADLYDVSPDAAYMQMTDAANSLMSKHVVFEQPGAKVGKKITKIQWVGSITYHTGEGWLELKFWHEMIPHLIGLREKFTTYKLRHAAALRSSYAWRLFELASSWNGTGQFSMPVDEFVRVMDCPAKYLENFKDLRRRVIEPAVEEIRMRQNLKLEWKPVKDGRKVASIFFSFAQEPQGVLALE